MILKKKKQLLQLIDTVSEMLSVLCSLHDQTSAVHNCLDAAEAISAQLKQDTPVPLKTIEQLEAVRASFVAFAKDTAMIDEASVKTLRGQLAFFKAVFLEEVHTKLKVLFLPYNVSMWDSLASIYEAAAKDPDCVTQVVPIPYYQMTDDETYLTYEGDRFPKDVPVTLFEDYDLAKEQPDIIFVHNIYDNFNAITQVPEQYFTYNLKKYTDMLVYVPYHISTFFKIKKGDSCLAYSVPTVENVDKIVVAGDFVKQAAIRDGIPKEKLLALGSPKFDSMRAALESKEPFPAEWRERIKGKTVYVLNTGCLFFSANVAETNAFMSMMFDITRYVKDTILIWRPHPLTNISILKYSSFFEPNYQSLLTAIRSRHKHFENVILDESDDYFPALRAADVLISDASSLLCAYLLTEKKVLYPDKEMPKNSLLSPDSFYFVYDEKEPWYELVRKFADGYDPLKKKRKGLASKVYANTDGTCGEKVYEEIRKCVFRKLGS